MELGLDLKLRSWSWNWSWNLRSWNWSWSWNLRSWSWSWYSGDLPCWNWNWSWNLRSWSWSWSWYSGDWPELELELKPLELELELELILWSWPQPWTVDTDKKPLNQLTVKNWFFFIHYQNILPLINTNVLFTKKQLIWVFESRKSIHYWWSYISFAPECKELTSIIQVGCPTCCYQVCALDHAKGGTADLDHPSQPCHSNIEQSVM